MIERLVVTTNAEVIEANDLPQDLAATAKDAPQAVSGTLVEITEVAEQASLVNALAANDYHREQTAKSLGISVRNLHYKMNRYDSIDPSDAQAFHASVIIRLRDCCACRPIA